MLKILQQLIEAIRDHAETIRENTQELKNVDDAINACNVSLGNLTTAVNDAVTAIGSGGGGATQAQIDAVNKVATDIQAQADALSHALGH